MHLRLHILNCFNRIYNTTTFLFSFFSYSFSAKMQVLQTIHAMNSDICLYNNLYSIILMDFKQTIGNGKIITFFYFP